MAGFTGPELAALVEVGTLLVCEPRHSLQMAQTLAANSHIRQIRSMSYWIESVYLIVKVLSDPSDKEGGDGIIAVCLSQPVAVEALREADVDLPQFEALYRRLLQGKFGEGAATAYHFISGPCNPEMCTMIACLECTPETALRQVPAVTVIRVDQGVWIWGPDIMVMMLVSKDIEADARGDARPTRPLQCFWGTAGWSRTQLLGEIARGAWGLCPCTRADVHERDLTGRELYGQIISSDRPIYAPKNEMMSADDD